MIDLAKKSLADVEVGIQKIGGNIAALERTLNEQRTALVANQGAAAILRRLIADAEKPADPAAAPAASA